jgi:uncharacterized membrane protein
VPVQLPTRSPILVAFAMGIALLIALVQLDFIEFAYERVGIAPQYVFAILVASLVGSYINFPIALLSDHARRSDASPDAFRPPGMQPVHGTILAVNLGGAVIPILLSAYLVVHNRVYAPALLATAVVSVIVHRMARPVPKVGISVPILVPPIAAAATALLLAPSSAPAVAYVAGTLGSLIGADLTNLHRLRGLGAPLASIGGAGTFDGIFLTGILAVLLA